jgi:hypothetical protein
MQRNLFLTEGRVRIELLDTIKQETIEGFEAKRSHSDVVSNSDRPESISRGITR